MLSISTLKNQSIKISPQYQWFERNVISIEDEISAKMIDLIRNPHIIKTLQKDIRIKLELNELENVQIFHLCIWNNTNSSAEAFNLSQKFLEEKYDTLALKAMFLNFFSKKTEMTVEQAKKSITDIVSLFEDLVHHNENLTYCYKDQPQHFSFIF
jgi:hypothetical protein